MTQRVVITGPLSPADIAELLAEPDRTLARSIQGYRGIPTSELVKALVALGAQVEVVTHAREVDDRLELVGPGLRVLVAPQRARARDLARDLFRRERHAMGALFRETEGKIIHALWTYEFAWAALDAGRPVLVTAQDAPLTVLRHARDGYRAVRAAMAYLVRARIRHLTAVSPYLAEQWRRQMLYQRPIAVVPNAVAPSLFEVGSTRNGSGPLVVDVTDAGARKNVQALVDAVRLLRSAGRAVDLDLVGPGLGPAEPLAFRMRATGSVEGIRFRGSLGRDDVAATLARATIFVHTSLEESFGVSVAEAMAAGLPVVGGVRSGAVPWVLDGGRAGRLVDVKRPSKIATEIERLLDDEAEAEAVGENGRRRALGLFSAEAVASSYLDEYDRVMRIARRR